MFWLLVDEHIGECVKDRKKKKWRGWSQERKCKTIVKTTMVVMAPGIGSRFGGGIKQLEPVDARGHIIMDYSIYDAKEAGLTRLCLLSARISLLILKK